MGRMIDILRSTDRRPTASAPADEPAANETEPKAMIPAPEVTEPDTHCVEPPLDDDDDVPFIEVGGPREPSLRLIPAPHLSLVGRATDPTPQPHSPETNGERIKTLPLPVPSREPESGALSLSPSSPALLTIRFQPIHAATLSARGPVTELIAYHQPDHSISGQYRALAAEITRQLPGAQQRVLLLAGAARGVGTSTVVLNLAATLARQDSTVTLVDANLARPALAERLALPSAPGLREVLAGRMPAAWCVQETVQPKLFVLPAGVAAPPRDDYDVTPLLATLREHSDWLLIDVGPWDDSPLIARLVGNCDAVYLVMRHSELAETAALQESVLQQTGRLRGCVLTARETQS